jgi:hypothetical protein
MNVELRTELCGRKNGDSGTELGTSDEVLAQKTV